MGTSCPTRAWEPSWSQEDLSPPFTALTWARGQLGLGSEASLGITERWVGVELEVPCLGGGVSPIKAESDEDEVQGVGANTVLGLALGSSQFTGAVGLEGICAPRLCVRGLCGQP